MDHCYSRVKDRIPGFQVVEEAWRHAPEHSYARSKEVTPQKQGKKRGVSTPTGITPKQPSKRATLEFDETLRHTGWSSEEKAFLTEFSQTPRKVGESENDFWRRCATDMNSMFGVKKRTGSSCKSAAWRMSLHMMSERPVHNELLDMPSLSETHDVAVQTEWSFPPATKSQPQDWVFIEPHMTLQKAASEGAETLNTCALKRLRTYADLTDVEKMAIMKALSACNSREAAQMLLTSPLRGNILQEVIYEIEAASRECCNRDSVLAQKDFTELCTFKWAYIIEEFTFQQPLLADVLLAVALPSAKIGNSAAVQKLVPVIGMVYGMLMKQRYQELSVLQKMIAVTLANEQTSQKVTNS